MFDGLLRRKFYSKCKTGIKLTKTRLDAIKRKRNAMQKFLKRDIADLLSNGLDINAYGRAEGLLIELNISSCYDFVEQFCDCISNNLSAMDKQRECPEECKEAVASLMFAAARFADLPELRDLRNIFTERYGNSLEAFVNIDFVEKFKAKPPTKEMKFQLLKDIARESSVEWDSKALEKKLCNPPAVRQDQPKKHEYLNNTAIDDECNQHKSKEESVPKQEQNAGNKHIKVKGEIGLEKDDFDLPSHGRQQKVSDGDKTRQRRGNLVDKGKNQDFGPNNRPKELPPGKEDLERSNYENEVHRKKPFTGKYVPPPYLKKPKPVDKEIVIQHGVDFDDHNHGNDSITESKQKPKSVRRRASKPPPGRENLSSFGLDETTKRHNVHHNNHDQKDDDGDDEERIMDELLVRYSSKRSPYDERDKVNKILKPPPLQQSAAVSGGRVKAAAVAPPSRAASLPLEPTSPVDPPRGHVRAVSLQPDMLNPSAHVHPKLPDYDDLAARLAALRGS